MGAWGTGSFDNDDAGDWAWELEASGMGAIQSAFNAVLACDDYLDAPDGSNAIAAAEVIAAILGRPTSEDLPEEVQQFLARTKVVDTELVERAKNAVARVLADDSELRELWQESDDYDEWRAIVTGLHQRLNG